MRKIHIDIKIERRLSLVLRLFSGISKLTIYHFPWSFLYCDI